MERIFAALLKALASLMHPRMLWLMVWPILVALSVWPLTLLGAWLVWLFLLFLFVPVVLVTAVLIISLVSMPAMVTHVGERDYPDVMRRKGGSFAGSLCIEIAALFIIMLLLAVTLPLWLIPLLWPVLPVVLFCCFNQRVFRYDALAEHATADEIVELTTRHRGELFLLGVALALVGHLPLVGLAMPVYGGLVFIHYELARLAESRSAPIEGSARRV